VASDSEVIQHSTEVRPHHTREAASLLRREERLGGRSARRQNLARRLHRDLRLRKTWRDSNDEDLCRLRHGAVWRVANSDVAALKQCEVVREGFECDRTRRKLPNCITKHVVYPLVDYLQTRLAAESEVLHRLERMRRQIEWFEQEKLHRAFNENTRKGEELFDRRVREFLFAEGIDYPFSQPASPAGKSDVVAGLDGEDPLVCEIKLYDGDAYGPTYLRRGVGQAIRYAHDYGKSSAYLVIFNLSDDRLQLPSDEAIEVSPPRLLIEGVTVFQIVVQAKPVPSASKDHHRQVRTLQREQLVPTKEDAAVATAASQS
jgi:hypothetical protein